jgi:hypothetical protein
MLTIGANLIRVKFTLNDRFSFDYWIIYVHYVIHY